MTIRFFWIGVEKHARDINAEMVMKVVAVRAAIGRFCTEFWCGQLCDDDIFGMVSKWNGLCLRVKVIGLFRLKRLKPITEQVYQARKVKRLTGYRQVRERLWKSLPSRLVPPYRYARYGGKVLYRRTVSHFAMAGLGRP